jgi:hypothetical protein
MYLGDEHRNSPATSFRPSSLLRPRRPVRHLPKKGLILISENQICRLIDRIFSLERPYNSEYRSLSMSFIEIYQVTMDRVDISGEITNLLRGPSPVSLERRPLHSPRLPSGKLPYERYPRAYWPGIVSWNSTGSRLVVTALDEHSG